MSKQLVADRDLKLMQIDEEIKHKRHLIMKKKKELEKKQLLNMYLEGVKKLVDTLLRTAKHDQKDIMNEIDKIKEEIDKLGVLSSK